MESIMDTLEARDAQHGQKMIEVQLRFWTNDIAESEGQIIQKHAWTSGVAKMESNEAHGIQSGDPIPFNSLLEISSAVEKTLIKHGITLHPDSRMRKYFDSK